MRRFAASSLCVVALALPGLAPAASVPTSRPNVALKLTGALVSVSADGHATLTPVEKVALKAGDEIAYEISAVNGGGAPALHLVPVARIPAGTAYVDGSAKAARGRAEFSLDGGNTWSSMPTVTVTNADGKTAVKKADPSLYTAVRFVTAGVLAPHAATAYRYEVRVR